MTGRVTRAYINLLKCLATLTSIDDQRSKSSLWINLVNEENMILIVDRDKPINRTRGIVLVESMVT